MGAFGVLPGMHGWMVTCFKCRERQTQSELITYLSHLDNLPSSLPETTLSSSIGSATISAESPAKQYKEELEALQAASKRYKPQFSHPFHVCPMGDIPCIIFIAFPKTIDPIILAKSYWDAARLGTHPLKRSQRLIPIQKICYASLPDILASLEILMNLDVATFCPKDYTPTTPINYKNMPKLVPFHVLIEARYHDPASLNKTLLTDNIAAAIQSRWSPLHAVTLEDGITKEPFSRFHVSLTAPKITICVQIMKNTCGLSIIPDFYLIYRKGNLHLLYDQSLTA
jgi:hypothetical protein